MWVREGGRRVEIVVGLVRSAAIRVIWGLGEEWGLLVVLLGGGEGGSIMSVRVRVEILGSVERAEARAWPRKPAAPVRRIFIFKGIGKGSREG